MEVEDYLHRIVDDEQRHVLDDTSFQLLDSIMMDDDIDHIIQDVANSDTPPVWSL